MSGGEPSGRRRSGTSDREDAGCSTSKRKTLPQNYLEWDVDDVCRSLRDKDLGQFEELFREKNIPGKILPKLTMNELESMGVSRLGDRRQLISCIIDILQRFIETKVFNDPIHGHIEMHPLLVSIIDTPQFQRLRFIKQLGATYFVYPGASHNRFEHSIGVAHLAGELVKVLARRQPELQVNNRDILCVQIAGLCHDLGHGPFSHVFDNNFISKKRAWKHEDASVKMFKYLISSNHLELGDYLVLPDDVNFIEELIRGPESGDASEGSEWPYKGRPQEKGFLYEIVANKRTGIDVDKWDYFARDSYHLGFQNNFDYQRILKYARVCEVDNMKVICFRDKVAGDLYNMFYTRNALHRRAYQHKVVNVIESMITEAMVLADPHILISGSGGRKYKMSEAIDDMEAYTKLTDSVFEQILTSSEPLLVNARTILNNIINRRLYKCIGQTQSSAETTIKQDEIANLEADVVKAVPSQPGEVQLEAKDLVVNDEIANLEADVVKAVPSQPGEVQLEAKDLIVNDEIANLEADVVKAVPSQPGEVQLEAKDLIVNDEIANLEADVVKAVPSQPGEVQLEAKDLIVNDEIANLEADVVKAVPSQPGEVQLEAKDLIVNDEIANLEADVVKAVPSQPGEVQLEAKDLIVNDEIANLEADVVKAVPSQPGEVQLEAKDLIVNDEIANLEADVVKAVPSQPGEVQLEAKDLIVNDEIANLEADVVKAVPSQPGEVQLEAKDLIVNDEIANLEADVVKAVPSQLGEVQLEAKDLIVNDEIANLEADVVKAVPSQPGEVQLEAKDLIVNDEIANLEADVVKAVPSQPGDVQLEAKDLIVNIIPMNYGMKEKNPINKVLFYCKSNTDKAFPIRREQVSQILPERFSEQLIQAFCKKTDENSVKAAQRHFAQWCKNRNLPEPWHTNCAPGQAQE